MRKLLRYRCFEEKVADQKCIKSSTKITIFLNKMRVKTVSKDALLCKQKHSKTQAVLEDNLWLQAMKVLMWAAHSTGQVMGYIFDARGLSDYP